MTETRVDLAAASWRKSSFSDGGGGDCVEIADNVPHIVPVRDSKNRTGPALLIPGPAWVAFVYHVKQL